MGNCLNERSYQVHHSYNPSSRNNKLIRHGSGQTLIQNDIEHKIENNNYSFMEINPGKISKHKSSEIAEID